MSIEQFEHYAMVVGITVLIGFMAWIIYDLARRSEAGKFGSFVLFFALGFGAFGFVIKAVLSQVLNV